MNGNRFVAENSDFEELRAHEQCRYVERGERCPRSAADTTTFRGSRLCVEHTIKTRCWQGIGHK